MRFVSRITYYMQLKLISFGSTRFWSTPIQNCHFYIKSLRNCAWLKYVLNFAIKNCWAYVALQVVYQCGNCEHVSEICVAKASTTQEEIESSRNPFKWAGLKNE